MNAKTEKAERMTVKELYETLGRCIDGGYGDAEIRCSKSFLHEDELCMEYNPPVFGMRGSIVYDSDYMRCTHLKSNIEKAFEKFHLEG